MLAEFKFHQLALFQRAESIALDLSVMNEKFSIAVQIQNEAIAAAVVKPDNLTFQPNGLLGCFRIALLYFFGHHLLLISSRRTLNSKAWPDPLRQKSQTQCFLYRAFPR